VGPTHRLPFIRVGGGGCPFSLGGGGGRGLLLLELRGRVGVELWGNEWRMDLCLVRGYKVRCAEVGGGVSGGGC